MKGILDYNAECCIALLQTHTKTYITFHNAAIHIFKSKDEKKK